MTAKELEKIIKKDGWYLYGIEGSHYQYKHPFKKGKITLPFHIGRDLNKKIINTVLKKSGLK